MIPTKISHWLQASRPFTLPASVSPVLVGAALALRDDCFLPLNAALCLLVAVSAQVASNYANDYFDYRNGSDTSERLGPPRAVASGWISAGAMLRATLIAVMIACVCGFSLAMLAGWELLLVGLAIVLCVPAYSAGPWPLSRKGLGDVCVVIFYGLVPVGFTYYVQAGRFGTLAMLLGAGTGLLAANILVANNCRDCEEDRRSGKRTTVVMFGMRFGQMLYMFNNVTAMLLMLILLRGAPAWFVLPYAAVGAMMIRTWRSLCSRSGRELIPVLVHTSRNLLLYALLAAWMAIAH
ncbi:MAG: 1,4-dihydroxy-2-naphthoate polyprenyltransferase [Tannerellaceae bacterium]|jgi:1,4-dihydroxy-2-naphthoate octaprenyltransferase|nr:1,4-dihydroxy-2-naphthoate polyprenyltransferase [Tannerellaceae bacterium]